MTSHELARQLLELPDEGVYFTYNYGDYTRTTVAGDITEIKVGTIEYSDYHSMMAVDVADMEEHDPEDGPVKGTTAILLS